MKSPLMGGYVEIRNPQVPIITTAKGLAELKYVESQIKTLEVVPDFGYEGDNFVIEEKQGHNGWNTLTQLIGKPERYQWLMNHIQLNRLKQEQNEKAKRRKVRLEMQRKHQEE